MNFIDIAMASEAPAEKTTHTTEGAATSESPLAGLGINGTLFVAQLVNFTLVALVLWFLILKPLTKKMSERQKMIDDSIDNAKKIQDNLNKSEKDYQTKVDQAKVEANKIMDKAVTSAQVAAVETKENAKKEIETLVVQARKSIKNEKETMKTELKEETANFIVLALQKILVEKMDSASDKKMIEEVLEKLK
ncbi:MAG: F0F1 ATP synthase subunit B [Candidatus Magasanikbacteria bacterium]